MHATRSARSRLVAVGAVLAVLVTMFPALGSAVVTEACPAHLPTADYRDLSGLSPDAVYQFVLENT